MEPQFLSKGKQYFPPSFISALAFPSWVSATLWHYVASKSECGSGDAKMEKEKAGSSSASNAGLGSAKEPSSASVHSFDTPDPKQWTEAELISLAEHMQQELDVRDR